MAFNNKNYYEILEVDAEADFSQIKSAYRKLARKYHPDINKEEGSIDKFKMITLAYETLSNPLEREKYDILKGIFKQTSEQKTSSQKAQEEYKNNKSTFEAQKSKPEKSKERKFSIVKAIKLLFARYRKHKKTKEIFKPQKGQKITTDVTISQEEAVCGCKRGVNVLTTQVCPNCKGHKFINGGKCSRCGGTGEISTHKKIIVTIPAGIKNGAKLRLKGEGASGKNGGENGDLFIIVRVEAEQKIRYDKLNIYYNIPITPFEAALGEEIKIPAIDGTIKLKLPKNTNSGQRFRISGQGIKKNGKVGDLIVTVSIEFSHDLSDDEIELYKKLKNLSADDVRKNYINESKN